jgi:outer membrane protein OmpA-like peptidoglycan-associated protein
MYLRPSIDEFSGYGIGPAAALELGTAALTFGSQLFTGGDFQTTSTVVNYMHENTPLEQRFISPPCRQRLLIEAYKPNTFVPLETAKQRHLAEKFWFQLSYEYNGNDLRNVAVEPLVNESSTLHKSQFKITFTGTNSSLARDPVAEVVFRIFGTWKAWQLMPFADTIVSFSGNLYVRADGFATVRNFTSEKGYVWLVGMHPYPLHGCPFKLPYKPVLPKPPVRKTFSLIPPILFPFNKATVSPNERKRIFQWIMSWPDTTRQKIARGEITITIEGFASRPGGEYSESNVKLAKDRAAAVVNILKPPLGSLATPKFDVRSYGAWMRNLPRLFDVSQWLQRFFDPNKYDQAVVIRFEDVE